MKALNYFLLKVNLMHIEQKEFCFNCYPTTRLPNLIPRNRYRRPKSGYFIGHLSATFGFLVPKKLSCAKFEENTLYRTSYRSKCNFKTTEYRTELLI